MRTYDPPTATCRIFTFKEGLLSAVAHDLELRVESFEVDIADDRSQVRASFEVGSIRVVGARVDGQLAPGTLSDKDKAKIESNLVKDVFGKRHDRVTFEASEASSTSVNGTLSMAGRSESITVTIEETDEAWTARAKIHQPRWGIKPFSAMLGALKIKPDVEVELTIKRSQTLKRKCTTSPSRTT